MNEFFQKIAEILEVDEVKEGDVLRDFAQWDSLSILTLIATIGSTYGVNLTAVVFKEAKTAGELWQIVQSRRPA